MSRNRRRREAVEAVHGDDVLDPDEFAAFAYTVATRLDDLAACVDAPPWRPQSAGGSAPTRPNERAPLYVAAVSALDEVRRGAEAAHREFVDAAGRCAVAAVVHADAAGRWLLRLAAEYRHAHPRVAAVDVVASVSDRMRKWDTRTASALGELAAPWPVRDEETGRPVRCPAYPRQDNGKPWCGAPLLAFPQPTTGVPQRIACDGGRHEWATPREWVRLGEEVAAAFPAGERMPSLAIGNRAARNRGAGGRA